MNIIFIKLQRMFNFTIFTKALTDTTLSKNEFRVLCLFLNTSSFKQSNTFEMYNGFIQDTLGISERNVRDITKSLELKDYIKKEVNTNSHNRNANIYTIIDTEKCAEKCAENCPPKTRTLQEDKNVPLKTNENIEKNEDKQLNDAINCAVFKENTIIDTEKCAENCPPNNLDIKNNKNNNITTGILELKDLGPKVTEHKKENKKEKVNEMKNAVLNEMEREVKNNEIQTSTSGEKNTNFNGKEPVYGNLTDDLFDEIFGLSSTEADVNVTGDNVEHSSTENENKATGDVETRSMEQLPTNEDKNATEGLKTQNNAYNLQDWMTEYQKLILQVENTAVEDGQFDTLLDEGAKLIEAFPKNEGNYQRAMQDLRYWVARKLDFKKSFKISEHWNKYYRAA